LERRRLLAVAMGYFTLANLLAALVPGYASLLGARLVLALSRAQLHAGSRRICRRIGRSRAAWPRSRHDHGWVDSSNYRRRLPSLCCWVTAWAGEPPPSAWRD